MMIFKTLSSKLMVLLTGALTCFATAQADFSGLPQIKHDGLNNIVAVWQTNPTLDSRTKIQGAFGPPNSWVVTDLTNLSLFDAIAPRLAVSTSNTATTKAAAVWIANDLTTTKKVIQGTTLTGSGWSTATIFSANDGTEIVRDDYQIHISADGMVIGVNWTAFMPLLNNTVVRYGYSIDGGATWNTPNTLSP